MVATGCNPLHEFNNISWFIYLFEEQQGYDKKKCILNDEFGIYLVYQNCGFFFNI